MAVDRCAENRKPGNGSLGKRPPTKLKSKDPFEFDAPRFTDFTRRKYRETKRLLDQIVLKQNPPSDDLGCEGVGLNSAGSSELSDGFWFNQVHSSHEPTSPLSPTGPLLSPGALLEEDTMMNVEEPETPASPSIRLKPTRTPGICGPSSDYGCHMSPNVSMVRPGGLRSKPGRVLTMPVAKSSLSRSCAMSADSTRYSSDTNPSRVKSGSPVTEGTDADELIAMSLGGTIRRTPLASHVAPRTATSPISRFIIERNQKQYEAKRSSPMKQSSPGPSSRLLMSEDTWTDGRISSLPSLEGWLVSSSRTDSPPRAYLSSDGPSPMKVDDFPVTDKPSTFGLRKLGMAARATRVQVAAPTTSSEPSRMPSPTVKRIRTDTHSFTAAAPSVPPERSHFAPIQKKGGAVKIEDLKKILAEHNQRLRPRKR